MTNTSEASLYDQATEVSKVLFPMPSDEGSARYDITYRMPNGIEWSSNDLRIQDIPSSIGRAVVMGDVLVKIERTA